MYWKLKAGIQNVAALLPPSMSYALYYWMQRRFGRLRKVNPLNRFRSAVEAWTRVTALGYDPHGKVFLEVGTGRVPCVPLAFWLMGAGRTVTLDLNPYLRAELTNEMIRYIRDNTERIKDVFGPLLDMDRLNSLLALPSDGDFRLEDFLDRCEITYLAPANATKTDLAPGTIDFHTSFRVFEHIPADTVSEIIKEGNRIVKDSGLFVHRIDYGDHFANGDPSITRINFLQYSDEKWHKYAGNRYMYMNRLRHDDFLTLFESTGHEILATQPDVDERCASLLQSGSFQLDEQFRSKTGEILSITGSWVLSRKRN
jgi:SAM-dependent methyltransferase